MAKKYYHNLSIGLMNETSIIDFVENSHEVHLMYYSEAGNALLNKVSEDLFLELKKEVDEYYKTAEDE